MNTSNDRSREFVPYSVDSRADVGSSENDTLVSENPVLSSARAKLRPVSSVTAGAPGRTTDAVIYSLKPVVISTSPASNAPDPHRPSSIPSVGIRHHHEISSLMLLIFRTPPRTPRMVPADRSRKVKHQSPPFLVVRMPLAYGLRKRRMRCLRYLHPSTLFGLRFTIRSRSQSRCPPELGPWVAMASSQCRPQTCPI